MSKRVFHALENARHFVSMCSEYVAECYKETFMQPAGNVKILLIFFSLISFAFDRFGDQFQEGGSQNISSPVIGLPLK